MQFEVRSRGAGSAGAILENSSVADVYSRFGDECLRCYGIDIREKPTFMSARVLRQVEAFTREYGEQDAKRIIGVMFNAVYNGNWKGRPLGTSIFSKSFRWLANQFLLEAGPDEEVRDGGDGSGRDVGDGSGFDPTSIKSLTA